MTISRSKKTLYVMMFTALILLLTACAKGEAHVTVHTDGTADVKFNMQLNNRNLELIGQPDLLDTIRESFTEQGFETETAATEDSKGLSATKKIDLNTSSMDLPDSIVYTHESDEGFLFTTHRIVVDADLMAGLPDNSLTDRLQSIPSFVRNLVLKDVDLDFKLTLPIKPESSNASQTSDDQKTLNWNIDPLSKNHLELAVKVPNITNIIITAVVAFIIVVVIIILIRKKKKRTP
ncbi:DUF3153 domain-containing protein [Neobacillus mesonae]|nr:DUF3153 domain-containing protein [Neobacillus mesonae]